MTTVKKKVKRKIRRKIRRKARQRTGDPPVGKHIVRYGSAADQEHLVGDLLDTYDAIVLNANIVAHMPEGLASFLMQRAIGKPYFIDPQTHAFQHGIDYLLSKSKKSVGEVKRSVQKLADQYKEPIARVLKNRGALLPRDLSKASTLTGFCERVVKFQLQVLSQAATSSDAAPYVKFAAKKKGFSDSGRFPALVVAPYFFMELGTLLDDWLSINTNCIEAAKEAAGDIPLAAQVVISQDVLEDRHSRSTIVKKYGALKGVAAFLIWIDEFSEHAAGTNALRHLVELIRGLAKTAPVYNLYGGYFSVALANLGLVDRFAGVAHGLGYGESRGVVPVGGGIPVAKYYLPALHGRLDFRDAVRAVRELGGLKNTSRFYANVCACPECKSVVTANPEKDFGEYGETKPATFQIGDQWVTREFPIGSTKQHAIRHYMWCKHREHTRTPSLNRVCAALAKARGLREVLRPSAVRHCRNWRIVLEELGP